MRVDTMLKKEKDGSLFKDTKLAHPMLFCLDEFLKISQETPIGKLVNQSDTFLSGLELPPGARKDKGQFPSTLGMPQHDPPAPPEDTEPPQVFDSMNKTQSVKLAGDEAPTFSEASKALKRLDKLERNKMTREELQRGALTGSIIGPTASTAAKLVSGDVGKAIRGALAPAEIKGVLTAKTRVGKAKALGLAAIKGVRGMGGAAASGAVFGAGLPTVRRKLEESSEKEKLREYLGVRKRGKLRSKIKKELGV